MTKQSYLEAVLAGVQQFYEAAQGSAGSAGPRAAGGSAVFSLGSRSLPVAATSRVLGGLVQSCAPSRQAPWPTRLTHSPSHTLPLGPRLLQPLWCACSCPSIDGRALPTRWTQSGWQQACGPVAWWVWICQATQRLDGGRPGCRRWSLRGRTA